MLIYTDICMIGKYLPIISADHNFDLKFFFRPIPFKKKRKFMPLRSLD